MSLPQERSTAELVFYTWVARSRSGSSSFTASALNKQQGTRIRSPPPLSPSFSSPPRRQANDDEHGDFPTEDSRRPEACQAGVDEKINNDV